MAPHSYRLFFIVALSYIVTFVSALGTTCSSPLTSGTAASSDPYWLQNIKHQGTSAFNSNPSSYTVFRNVKDYGAVGNGVTDDTAAINAAISAGNRCGDGTCASSTVTPALVYFPQGTYLVSSPIIAYYYTELVGDARNPPTLLAAPSFAGMAVIDADPYLVGGGGSQWYTNQNNFFRSVRNFVIDVSQMPATSTGTGIHWQVAQATSLTNIHFVMSQASNTAHQGIWMENGSGGYMGDLVFTGGKFGMWVGNQQFTVRNITINNAQTGVFGLWNWGWTFQRVTINNCQVGFDLATGGLTEDTQTVGAEAIIDAVVTNTPIFVRTSSPSTSLAGSIVLNNVQLNNVTTAVGVVGGAVVLAGGTMKIDSWGQGNVYTGTNPTGQFVRSNIVSAAKPASLLDGSGFIFAKTRPQYVDYSTSQIVSVKDHGAVGDGTTDDTAALTSIFNQYAGCKIIFFDAGTYIVTSTLTIPAGTQMVGEAWSVIAGKGSAFQDQSNPQVVVRVGAQGSQGTVEISDIIFSRIYLAPGAIVVEWNVHETTQGGTGMWDSHIRLGGAAGTGLELATCPSSGAGGYNNCYAAFLALHLTSGSTAYLEGTWVWLADHDLDGNGVSQLTIYSGRGILSESAGPVWLIGTAEHHVLYQYNLVNAQNHYMGLIQTETPYFQPSPEPPTPFSVNSSYHDPAFGGEITMALGLRVATSSNIIVFGAGLYSFYSDYSQTCLNSNSCQMHMVDIDSASSITIYSLATVASIYQISINNAGVISENDNVDGFASLTTAWSPA
ncbi:exo-beta-1,3-glucanase [Guyanagaster necrorhizus]|uniref:Exo-beta-1,3-glucanase n=1 Tax=Guyanagaster necrorhizus TaxID=856835 RepID=A0A9P8AYU7_9AGAR|nr:exo-beta-1,3-glucanase [Guyanagaster necrorhizus MCA 3950]KAG7453018.1 exo-beta-1,3-glucanase [Guyanagaster necrorhizus MCA 3950]